MSSNKSRAVDVFGASEYSGLGVRTLRHYYYTNQGPPTYRLGRRIMYDLADLDQWMEERKVETLRTNDDVGGTS